MTTQTRKPIYIINCVAPIRICDNGGWTDTWFAGHGKIFNIGVYPYAEVQLKVYEKYGRENRIIINAENFGERYTLHPETLGWDRHPLLEAAIERMRIPDRYSFEVSIYSEAPAGAATGTSAAVTVALVGALDCLTPGRLTQHEIAYLAQSIEVDNLKQQCGIQDQLCSAYGGINYIEMFDYPRALVSQIQIPNSTWWELERRIILIYLGKSHSSSKIHERVIRELENAGPECKKIDDLRITAEQSRDALYAADFERFGRVMIENTEAQARLNHELVSPDALKIIGIAQEHGALGWKVNGAGGDGGSVALLCNEHSNSKRAMVKEIEQENEAYKNIPLYLSHYGIRIWEYSGN
jgi:D-glycero-alpha-D-manno-heptose-7-phosphate kinase